MFNKIFKNEYLQFTFEYGSSIDMTLYRIINDKRFIYQSPALTCPCRIINTLSQHNIIYREYHIPALLIMNLIQDLEKVPDDAVEEFCSNLTEFKLKTESI